MWVVWMVVLAISFAAYGFLMTYVMPHYFLKTEYAVTETSDRGIKNVKETTGRSIVYQPAMKYRKFISQYLISERDGKKILKCKLAPNVEYVDYDVVMFNRFRKAFNILNVKELCENGYTDELELSKDTAYVSLLVNGVNDASETQNVGVTDKTLKPVTKRKMAMYALACSGLTVVQVFLVKLCCSYAFGGVFREIFMTSGTSNLLTLLLSAVAVIINVIFIFCALNSNRKDASKGE